MSGPDVAELPQGALSIDVQRRSAFVGGRLVPLTAREYLLIELLFTSRGRLFSRDDLLERLWGLDFSGDARVVDTYVKRLRGKLGAASIETVRGLGYRCPLPETGRVPQPHLQRLPREARLLTRLAQRVLQVAGSAQIVADLYEQLREHYDVQEVTLWRLPQRTLLARAGSLSGAGPQQTALPAALPFGAPSTGGTEVGSTELGSAELGSTGTEEAGMALVPLYGSQNSAAPWGVLAFAGAPEQGAWPLDVRSALDAAASLVNLALRLNSEIEQREQAEAQLRALNTELEARVAARTQELARANANLNTLYDLAQTLASADGLGGVLRQGLTSLAALAGASVCSLWQLRATELSCLAAYTPAFQDCTALLQRESGLLTSALRQSVALTAESETLTRTATLHDGRQLLLIPVAPGLPEVYALHLELPHSLHDNLRTDMVQLDAAARAFGLAFERQWQTQRVERAALSDELTGLPNRRALLADLTAELAYSQRHRQTITLSLFELRDIREVNKRSGNAAGNDLIRALADRLRGTLRAEDRIYRLGGAVLVSLVRHETAPEAQRLRGRLDRMVDEFGTQLGALPLAQPGDGQVWSSHASSPDETVKLSDLLHLALQRLERVPEGQQP